MLTQDNLKKIIDYNPDTGIFTWIQSTALKIKIGQVAGTETKNGYRQLRYKNKCYLLHKLAFLYMTGSIPIEVDHIDTVKDNNKWNNLRGSTKAQNQHNVSLRVDNTSGIKGVCWNKKTKRWITYLKVQGKVIHRGCFINIEDAKSDIRLAREKYHVEFTNHG